MSLDSRYADRKRPLIIDNPWIIPTEKKSSFLYLCSESTSSDFYRFQFFHINL